MLVYYPRYYNLSPLFSFALVIFFKCIVIVSEAHCILVADIVDKFIILSIAVLFYGKYWLH